MGLIPDLLMVQCFMIRKSMCLQQFGMARCSVLFTDPYKAFYHFLPSFLMNYFFLIWMIIHTFNYLQERGGLRCHEHTSMLDQWTLTEKQVELVEKAGFGYLRLIPAISLDNALISALVERWRRETNTFHLNVGEMTVTLRDVALLLGLAIDGEPVIGITHTTCNSVCDRYLGKVPEPSYTSGGMVKLSWLKELFSHCPKDAPLEVVECHTRAYLLYLVGSTIFSTTTGNKVPVMYLPLFENFDDCGRYAWGAAALAFLYRSLGNASLRSQSTISGCLTLLQVIDMSLYFISFLFSIFSAIPLALICSCFLSISYIFYFISYCCSAGVTFI